MCIRDRARRAACDLRKRRASRSRRVVSCSVFHYENHALMFITGAAFTRRAFAVFLEPQSTRILPGLMANLNRTNNPQKHIMKYNTKWLAAPLGIASGLFIACLLYTSPS